MKRRYHHIVLLILAVMFGCGERHGHHADSPESGRALEVLTTQPAVQIYTGNWLAGCPRAKCGRSYFDYEGVAIECQHCPDSPNKPEYPTTVLRPGEIYEEAIIFAFSVR